MWHWGNIGHVWMGSGTDLHEYAPILLHLQQILIEDKCFLGNTCQHMYGLYMKRGALMRRML